MFPSASFCTQAEQPEAPGPQRVPGTDKVPMSPCHPLTAPVQVGHGVQPLDATR